jgi:hypothetical protein
MTSKSWHVLPVLDQSVNAYPSYAAVLLPPDFGTPLIDDGISTRMEYIKRGLDAVVALYDTIVVSKMSKDGCKLKMETASGLFPMFSFSRHVCDEFPDDLIYVDILKRGGDIFPFKDFADKVVKHIREL